ncbi:hypothetical protein D5270_04960 [Acutalibacter sp. 1XD8-36]|nr:hypothetical protein [Acutalibacter sp. 1XD8-36]
MPAPRRVQKNQPAGQSISSPAGKQPEPGGDIPQILHVCQTPALMGDILLQARKRFRAAIHIVTAPGAHIHTRKKYF